MKKISLLILIIGFSKITNSQNIFRTQEGHIIASGTFDTTQFIAESHKLFITFNNEYQNLNGKILLNTFIFGIPEIDSTPLKSKPIQILLAGNVPVDFLSWEHNELNVDIQIAITINGITQKEILKATFNHLTGGSTFTCMLSGYFKIDLSKYALNEFNERFKSELNVQLTQLVLRSQ